MQTYDFANILLAGPCNQRCPHCIGQQTDPALNRNNLDEWPLRNLEVFAALLEQHRVRQIVVTGTTTDPQLYRHEARLIRNLRKRVPGAQLSLHTNGQLALKKMAVFNLYDRATISFPSFDAATFERMTGTQRMPDLAAILRQARIPIKASCIIDECNVGQVDEFLVDPVSGHITHLILRKGHLWGQKDVTIPVSEIARVEEDTVYLKLTKEQIEALPTIPVRRR